MGDITCPNCGHPYGYAHHKGKCSKDTCHCRFHFLSFGDSVWVQKEYYLSLRAESDALRAELDTVMKLIHKYAHDRGRSEAMSILRELGVTK